MTADLSTEALDALLKELKNSGWYLAERGAHAITALRAEVEAGIAARNLLGTKWAAAEDRALAAEVARQEALMQSIADAGQAQEAHDARLKAEAEREAAMAGAVRVRGLEWLGTYDDRGDGTAEHNGGYEAETPFGIYEISMGYGPDGYYWSVSDEAGNEVASEDSIDAAQASGHSDVARRVLSAIEPTPAAQDRENALIAATLERAEDACADYPRVAPDESEWTRYDEQIAHSQACIRALATQPQTDALAARDRAMRAEGMRKAVEIYENGTPEWDVFGAASRAILTAAEKEADRG